MNTLSSFSRLLAALVAAAGLMILSSSPVAHAQDSTQAQPMQEQAAGQDVVSTLESRGNFTTLLGALEQTGLAETLSGGQYTIFAPTDEAFAALPAGTLDALSADQLAGILRLHLVEGAAMADDAVSAGTLSSVQGGQLTVEGGSGSEVTVNGNAVTEADIEAGDSVIHVIDGVLMPEGMGSGAAGSSMEADTTGGR